MAPPPFSVDEHPNADAMRRAIKLAVFDEKSKPHLFGDLIKAGKDERVIVVFIRHFYCGMCQQYVSHVNSMVTPESLAESHAKLLFIGHGDSALIKEYSQLTENRFPMYSQPSKDLHQTLGLTLKTLDRGNGSELGSHHASKSFFSSTVQSIYDGIKMGGLFGKPGAISQQGGEFIFGEGNRVIFTHRMPNSRGHLEASELFGKAGVAVPDEGKSDTSPAAAAPAAAPASPHPAPTPAAQTAPEAKAIEPRTARPTTSLPPSGTTSVPSPAPSPATEPTALGTAPSAPPGPTPTAANGRAPDITSTAPAPRPSEPNMQPNVSLPASADHIRPPEPAGS